MLKWVLGVVAAVVVLATAGLFVDAEVEVEVEKGQEDREYSSIQELKETLVDAGYECPSWGKVYERLGIDIHFAGLECSNGDYLAWFGSSKDAAKQRDYEHPTDRLIGKNWGFESTRASKFHDALGGELLKPSD